MIISLKITVMSTKTSDDLRLSAIVLKNMPVGENDRLVTLLSMEFGKISAFARGARRPASPLLAATIPFVMGTFNLYPGRTSYTLRSAEIKEHFSQLYMDLEASSYGSYFLEIADYYTRENAPDEDMLRLLYISLKALLDDRFPRKLIRYIFEIRSMVCEGEFPGLMEGVVRAAMLDNASIHAIEHIQKSSLKGLYTFNLSEDSCRKLGSAAGIYRSRLWDRTPKSLSVIESLEREDY